VMFIIGTWVLIHGNIFGIIIMRRDNILKKNVLDNFRSTF
jgi:hypothetical protein